MGGMGRGILEDPRIFLGCGREHKGLLVQATIHQKFMESLRAEMGKLGLQG